MLLSLLKLHKPLLVFLAEPMVSYTDVFEVLFKYVNMDLVAMSPIVNKSAKLWCLSVPNLVQNFAVMICLFWYLSICIINVLALQVFIVLTHT